MESRELGRQWRERWEDCTRRTHDRTPELLRGSFEFHLHLGDDIGMTVVTGNFTVKVDPASNPLAIAIAPTIADLVEGVAVTQDAPELVATISGGTKPYTYSNAQGLPPGMQLGGQTNDDGTESLFLVGTPAAGDSQTNGGVYAVSFDVADSSTPAQVASVRVTSAKK